MGDAIDAVASQKRDWELGMYCKHALVMFIAKIANPRHQSKAGSFLDKLVGSTLARAQIAPNSDWRSCLCTAALAGWVLVQYSSSIAISFR